ncbi:MAG: hypothetical protein JXN64_15990 [Spirochaetes bacterium]|nr:hypothetical protein [Spirochaetota bacterium]
MKIKYVYIAFIIILLVISIAQIFSIPPYAGNIFSVYKSGYFKELDNGFQTYADSFLNIKMMSRPVYAWIFLKDMQKKNNMNIRVYNNKGLEVQAPGETRISNDDNVLKILNSLDPKSFSRVIDNRYYSAIPVFIEDRCRFCHTNINRKNIAGVITFERDYDAHIYYSSERVIIFVLTSLALLILLYYIIKWDPARAVKELFDKSK